MDDSKSDVGPGAPRVFAPVVFRGQNCQHLRRRSRRAADVGQWRAHGRQLYDRESRQVHVPGSGGVSPHDRIVGLSGLSGLLLSISALASCLPRPRLESWLARMERACRAPCAGHGAD